MRGALNNRRHAFNDLVTRFMTKAVINALEVIDVDHQAAYRLIVTHGLLHLSAERIFQMVAITQPR